MDSTEQMFRNGCHHVVGRGRLGQTLESGLEQADRKLTRKASQADVVWFCVPESVLGDTVIRWSEEMRPGVIRLHTSGYLPASVLDDKAGSWRGALHPAYSFHKPLSHMPGRIFWTFEGSPELRTVVAELVACWDGSFHILEERYRQAYHIICVLLANLTAVPFSIAGELSRQIGLPFREMTESLLLPVLDRMGISDHSDLSALTGPAARGDDRTVSAQSEWLAERDPIAADVYRSLSEAIRKYRDQSDGRQSKRK